MARKTDKSKGGNHDSASAARPPKIDADTLFDDVASLTAGIRAGTITIGSGAHGKGFGFIVFNDDTDIVGVSGAIGDRHPGKGPALEAYPGDSIPKALKSKTKTRKADDK
jgi:hypothetical protein